MRVQVALAWTMGYQRFDTMCKKSGIVLSFDSYEIFFEKLYKNCGAGNQTYIPWECTPNKTDVSLDILKEFKKLLQPMDRSSEVILFTRFEKKIVMDAKGNIILNKQGNPVTRLVPVQDHVNAKFLVNFMRELLPKLVHHGNMLKLYHNLKAAFLENLECTYIDIDFSENLTVGIKWEPQSLHWSKKQVTVHSGIVKVNGNKVYHPYVSNSRVHDQIFVKSALEEMIESTDGLNDSTTLVI